MSDEVTGADPELARMAELKRRLFFLSPTLQLGAVVTSSWMIFLVFHHFGIVAAIASFIAISMIFKFGVAPMFAVAASILAFYFKAVGPWLPIITYVLAAISLCVDIKADNLKRQHLAFDVRE